MSQDLDVIAIISKVRVILRRRLDLILLPTLLLLPGAFILFKLAPKRYRASTQLHITQLNKLVDNKRTAPREQRQQIELLINTMKSHKILSRLGYEIKNRERAKQKLPPITKAPSTRSELLDDELRVVGLRQKIQIYYLGHGLVQMSYSCRIPRHCLNHINMLFKLFMKETLRPHQESIRRSTLFLEKQLSWMKEKLEKKERLLLKFKQKYNLDRPKTFQILSNTYLYLKKNLNNLEMKTAAQEKTVTLLKSKLQFMDPELVKVRNRMLRLLQLQRRFAQLRSKYTFRHPDVIQVHRQYSGLISKIKRPRRFSPRSLKALIRSLKWESRKSGGGTNGYQKGLFDKYEDAQGKLSTLQRRLLANQQQIQKLEARLAKYPSREQTLRKLRRDADVAQATYLKLVTLYQKTLLQRELEVFDATRRVRVIEPARLPLFPESPKKTLFLGGGLVAALLLSVLLIAFAELFYPSLQGPKEVANVLGIEVLGEIDELSDLDWR
jgi:uncharacterized protein involved in exopolysaccharide biosynthesis